MDNPNKTKVRQALADMKAKRTNTLPRPVGSPGSKSVITPDKPAVTMFESDSSDDEAQFSDDDFQKHPPNEVLVAGLPSKATSSLQSSTVLCGKSTTTSKEPSNDVTREPSKNDSHCPNMENSDVFQKSLQCKSTQLYTEWQNHPDRQKDLARFENAQEKLKRVQAVLPGNVAKKGKVTLVKCGATPTSSKNVSVVESPRPGATFLQLFTQKVVSNDVALITRSKYGLAAYLQPLKEYIKSNSDHCKINFHIDHVFSEVDPEDPTQAKRDPPSEKSIERFRKEQAQGLNKYDAPYQPEYLTVIMTVPDDKANLNDKAFRAKFGEMFEKLANAPLIMSMYKYGGTKAKYCGDLSPLDEKKLNHMSKILTLRDTMTVIQESYKNQENGQQPEISDILECDDILDLYYTTEHKKLVREMYHSEGIGGSSNTTADMLGVPTFQF